MLKEYLIRKGIIKKPVVSPNNMLVNSFIYGIDDNHGPVSKDNILVKADIVKTLVEKPEEKLTENV
ncbi:MAG: hypothetical protein Q8L28_01415 [bacterium]|nr:hypothetical protein [bacterium]